MSGRALALVEDDGGRAPVTVATEVPASYEAVRTATFAEVATKLDELGVVGDEMRQRFEQYLDDNVFLLDEGQEPLDTAGLLYRLSGHVYQQLYYVLSETEAPRTKRVTWMHDGQEMGGNFPAEWGSQRHDRLIQTARTEADRIIGRVQMRVGVAMDYRTVVEDRMVASGFLSH